jgi:hypothetical protein
MLPFSDRASTTRFSLRACRELVEERAEGFFEE